MTDAWNAADRWANARTRSSCGTSDGIERAPGRRTERGGDARPEREEVERPGLVGARPRHGEQADRHDRVERDRHREHGAPRVPVGEVSCRECEQRQRQEHREPDEAEVERIAIDRVDLPPDRDERHLDRERGRHRGDDVEREVPIPKWRAHEA